MMAGAALALWVGVPATAWAQYTGTNTEVKGTELRRDPPGEVLSSEVVTEETDEVVEGLPVTGGDVVGLAVIGLGALGAGTLLVRRSRRVSSDG